MGMVDDTSSAGSIRENVMRFRFVIPFVMPLVIHSDFSGEAGDAEYHSPENMVIALYN